MGISVGALADGLPLTDFLESASREPCGLVIDGAPGIGKTTVWSRVIAQARRGGFTVLSTRATQAKSVLAYQAVVALLSGLDAEAWAGLPVPQRQAIERALTPADAGQPATDQRAVGAALVAVVNRSAKHTPVLLAIDDIHWLDRSSVSALAFVTRRLTGSIGVVATARTDGVVDAASWLQLPRPDSLRRIRVPPMTLGALRVMLADRLDKSFPRPALARIHQVSGGNPLYALELARTTPAGGPDLALPPSLGELVRTRIEDLDEGIQDVLLVTASLASPTVDVVARATGTGPEDVIATVDRSHGVIEIRGQRLRFTHPLLAAGVYSNAPVARRRAVHHRLSTTVEEPELMARHLALASERGDSETWQRLDVAAEIARQRGAPTAAAELTDLARDLGGDTVQRRLSSARYHLDAGDSARARSLLDQVIAEVPQGVLRAEAMAQLGHLRMLDDSFVEASAALQSAVDEAADDPRLRVEILTNLSIAQSNSGDSGAALRTADAAVTEAGQLNEPGLLGQALSLHVLWAFVCGHGVDEDALARARELMDPETDSRVLLHSEQPIALVLALTGHIDAAADLQATLHRRCADRGNDRDVVFAAHYLVMTEIWRGNIAEATAVADDAMERALLLGGDVALCGALTMRGALGALAGRTEQARADTTEAVMLGLRAQAGNLVAWPLSILSFVELSVGNYTGAVAAVEPLLAALRAMPEGTELCHAICVPDAVEALAALGRFDEALGLTALLEGNGRRLDRPWMLAMAGRCRAVVLGAQGDVEGAVVCAERAIAEHDRLPMRFERARTALVLGQLQRRLRRKKAAAQSLRAALEVFGQFGAQLWVERARVELSGVDVESGRSELTEAEARIAELVAAGATNKEVAVTIFVSPKTVEARLSRIYRKLGIRSRTELGSALAKPNTDQGRESSGIGLGAESIETSAQLGT